MRQPIVLIGSNASGTTTDKTKVTKRAPSESRSLRLDRCADRRATFGISLCLTTTIRILFTNGRRLIQLPTARSGNISISSQYIICVCISQSVGRFVGVSLGYVAPSGSDRLSPMCEPLLSGRLETHTHTRKVCQSTPLEERFESGRISVLCSASVVCLCNLWRRVQSKYMHCSRHTIIISSHGPKTTRATATTTTTSDRYARKETTQCTISYVTGI